MADQRSSPDTDAAGFQSFLLAGINDLNRIAGDDPTGPKNRSRLPPIPQAAQLSMFLLLVAKGLEPQHEDIYPHRSRLTAYLDKIYKTSTVCWNDAVALKNPRARESKLEDTGAVAPYVAALMRFTKKKFGPTFFSLGAFGVTDVQSALGELVKKVAARAGQEIGLELLGADGKVGRKRTTAAPAKQLDVPEPVVGGLLVASVAGDVGIHGKVTRDQIIAMRVGVGIGAGKPMAGKPEAPAVKKLRRTLNGLAEHICTSKS